jgi:hypothetical protein
MKREVSLIGVDGKGRAAEDNTARTVMVAARGQSTSKYLCCVSGSMKLATH